MPLFLPKTPSDPWIHGAGGRTRTNMNRDTEDWKDADPDIPELIEARERLGELKAEDVSTR